MWRLSAILLFCVPSIAGAAEFFAGDEVRLPAGTTYRDDLYVAGGTLRIASTIEGDLVIAGGDIEIDGPVRGDVIVAGGSVRIGGAVGGSVRSATGRLRIEAPIGEDVVATAGQVVLDSGASIGRDLVAQAGSLEVAAPVGRGALLRAGEATVTGDVEGDLRAEVGTLEVGAVRIGGRLIHAPEAEVDLDPGAQVMGGVVTLPPAVEEEERPGGGPGIFFWVRLLVGLWALGALFVLIAPRWSDTAVGTELHRPGASALAGLVLFLGLPAAALLALILGFFVGGWWIGLLLFFVWIIAVALALPTTALAVARLIAGRLQRGALPWPLLLLGGVLLLVILLAIPVLGGIVALLAVIFGLGALALGTRAGRAPAPPTG